VRGKYWYGIITYVRDCNVRDNYVVPTQWPVLLKYYYYDTFRVVRMTIVSDASSYGITYDCHSDNSRGVTYVSRVINCNSQRVFIVQVSLMMIII
jgi:hypothetical protein